METILFSLLISIFLLVSCSNNERGSKISSDLPTPNLGDISSDKQLLVSNNTLVDSSTKSKRVTSVQCIGITKANKQCKNHTLNRNSLCTTHKNQVK